MSAQFNLGLGQRCMLLQKLTSLLRSRLGHDADITIGAIVTQQAALWLTVNCDAKCSWTLRLHSCKTVSVNSGITLILTSEETQDLKIKEKIRFVAHTDD